MAQVARFVLFLAFVIFPSAPVLAQKNSELSSYKLGSGDMITIRVLGEPSGLTV